MLTTELSAASIILMAPKTPLLRHARDWLLSDQRIQDRAPATNRANGFTVKDFASYCEGRGVSAPRDVTNRLARDYWSHLKRRGLAKTTIASTLSALRVWFRWLLDEGHVQDNPFKGFRAEPVGDSVRPPAVPENGRELIALIGRAPKTFINLRDRALISMLFHTGRDPARRMRPAEALRLTLSDIDFDNGTIRTIAYRTARSYPMNQELRGHLGAYLIARGTALAEHGISTPLVFLSYGRARNHRMKGLALRAVTRAVETWSTATRHKKN